jgi:hypothetical protein
VRARLSLVQAQRKGKALFDSVGVSPFTVAASKHPPQLMIFRTLRAVDRQSDYYGQNRQDTDKNYILGPKLTFEKRLNVVHEKPSFFYFPKPKYFFFFISGRRIKYYNASDQRNADAPRRANGEVGNL